MDDPALPELRRGREGTSGALTSTMGTTQVRGGVRSAPQSYHNSPEHSRFTTPAGSPRGHSPSPVHDSMYSSGKSGTVGLGLTGASFSSSFSSCFGVHHSPSAIFSRSPRGLQRPVPDGGDIAQVCVPTEKHCAVVSWCGMAPPIVFVRRDCCVLVSRRHCFRHLVMHLCQLLVLVTGRGDRGPFSVVPVSESRLLAFVGFGCLLLRSPPSS